MESIPFTKAPSNGEPDESTGTGRGSSNAARRAHIELSSSLCNYRNYEIWWEKHKIRIMSTEPKKHQKSKSE